MSYRGLSVDRMAILEVAAKDPAYSAEVGWHRELYGYWFVVYDHAKRAVAHGGVMDGRGNGQVLRRSLRPGQCKRGRHRLERACLGGRAAPAPGLTLEGAGGGRLSKSGVRFAPPSPRPRSVRR